MLHTYLYMKFFLLIMCLRLQVFVLIIPKKHFNIFTYISLSVVVNQALKLRYMFLKAFPAD